MIPGVQIEHLVIGLLRGDFSGIATRTERRSKEKRIPCDPAPVQISPEGGLAAIHGYVVDVSKSGIRIRSNTRLQRGVKVTAKIHSVLMTGRLRYCIQNRHTSSFDIGLQIDDVTTN
jgi:PilZ domain